MSVRMVTKPEEQSTRLTRAEWATAINARWQDSVDGILDTGALLIEARRQLEGEFEAMVAEDLTFGPRTARMLKVIAAHGVLSERKHASALPPSWYTLYQLTTVPIPLLELALEDGRIHPGMERKDVQDLIREEKRTGLRAHLDAVAAREIAAPTGLYDVLIIDPPWPMEKIERDERPNQSELDYPTMNEAELRALTLPAAADCHVWLWTTPKFLPLGLALLPAWGLTYVCPFVWHKPGGFQPYNLPQYNCEFALYARKGHPSFLDTKEFQLCFAARRAGHSEKPDYFYDVVRRVTGGRRLDLFNRRVIAGFTGWGKETGGTHG